jgi:hypothetical protein
MMKEREKLRKRRRSVSSCKICRIDLELYKSNSISLDISSIFFPKKFHIFMHTRSFMFSYNVTDTYFVYKICEENRRKDVNPKIPVGIFAKSPKNCSNFGQHLQGSISHSSKCPPSAHHSAFCMELAENRSYVRQSTTDETFREKWHGKTFFSRLCMNPPFEGSVSHIIL